MSANNPPPDVAAAARVVQSWLDQQNGTQPAAPARKMSDAERLDYCRGFDQSKMPPNPHDVNRAGRT